MQHYLTIVSFITVDPTQYNTLLIQMNQIMDAGPSMVIKAPGRINLIGEHTDYNGGWCMPAAIDLGVYFALAPASETNIISIDQNNSWSPGQKSNVPDWSVYFRGVLDLMKSKGFSWPYFKLAFGGDLPIGAGLSSSSAITCGFVVAIDEWAEWNFDIESLCQIAIESERACGLEGGIMDQISIFNGRKDQALLLNCADVSFKYFPVQLEDFCWVIVDTGVKHNLVDSDYNSRSRRCKTILTIAKNIYPEIQFLSEINRDQYENLKPYLSRFESQLLNYILNENDRVLRFSNSIQHANAIECGKILFDGHEGLSLYYKVSCPELDFLVSFAQLHPAAIGARMMGGGFGGSSIHLVNTDQYDEYKTAISSAYCNRYGFRPFIQKVIIDQGVHRFQ